VRQKLEKVDISGDLQSFITACGTGTEKPGLTDVLRYARHFTVYPADLW